MNLWQWFWGTKLIKDMKTTVEGLVPFILKWESGAVRKNGESLTLLFDRAKKTGWSNDPLDLGGETMCGVTLATYKSYCRKKGYPTPTAYALKEISYEEWLDVLKTLFWDRWKADEIKSQKIANFLVDWVWASGVYGIKLPQELVGVTADGVVGPMTIEAINHENPDDFLLRLYARRVEYYNRLVAQKPNQKKWLKGWMNRLNDIMKYEG